MAVAPTVGIDIGTQQIKVAELRVGKSGRLTATALGVAPTPLGVMQNNIITDPQLMGQTIRQLVRESGISAKRTVAGIAGGSAVVIRIIEVPRMTDAELKETMKWEIERHVPFAPNESVMDYQPLAAGAGAETNPNMEVLLAVAQQDVVTNLVDTIFNAGLDPIAIDIEPLATSRALLDVVEGQPVNYAQRIPSALDGHLMDGSAPEETVAIVNIGASNTDICIYVNGQLAFPRSLPLAGDSFTRAIAEALGYAPDQAERVKRDYAAVQIDKMAQYTGNAYEEGGYDTPEFTDEGGGFTTTPSGRLMTPSGRIETPSGRLEKPSQRLSFEDNLPLTNPFDMPPDPSQADAEPSLTDDLDRTQPIPRSTLNLAKRPDLGTGGFGLGGGVPGQDFGFLGGAEQDNPETRNQVFEAIAPVLGELATELRRSLDYYRSRAEGRSVDRVLLTGGSASLGNLGPYLQHELQVPVLVAEPLSGMDVVTKSYDPNYLRSIAPVFSVAIGLAAREAVFNANPAPKAAAAPKAAKAPKEPKAKKVKAGAK